MSLPANGRKRFSDNAAIVSRKMMPSPPGYRMAKDLAIGGMEAVFEESDQPVVGTIEIE